MLAIKPGETLALEDGIVLHSLPDQDWYYAFSVATGDQFLLNQTSFWVLETISNNIEWNHLRDRFLTVFEVSALQGEADLKKLVSDFSEQKIIRRSNDEKQKDQI